MIVQFALDHIIAVQLVGMKSVLIDGGEVAENGRRKKMLQKNPKCPECGQELSEWNDAPNEELKQWLYCRNPNCPMPWREKKNQGN
jgi:hypothetical protein